MLFKSSFPKIEALSKEMSACSDMDRFLEIMKQHELLLSELLEIPRVQSIHFSDFKGQIKSLGAWGGDFVMAGSKEVSLAELKTYFKDRGFHTVLSYSQMVCTS